MLFALLALPLLLSLCGLGRWAWLPVAGALALPVILPAAAAPGTSWEMLPGLPIAVAVQTARQQGLMQILLWVYLAVHIYSAWYLPKKEDGARRYFALLGLFLMGMATLMAAESWLALLLGWETIGLASFGLVSYYRDAEGVGRQAGYMFWINRFGDLALIAGVALGMTESPWAVYALVLAAVVKSAQVPFSIWLPWAMVGPTPVSALLHAATLVVSGIVLLTHPLVQPLLAAEPLLCQTLTLWAALTALLSAWAACRAENLKRLLAYSTLAHVALMMLWVYIPGGAASLWHMGAHAFFKTGLFLALGLLHTYDRVPPAPWKEVYARLKSSPWALAAFGAAILFAAALIGVGPFAAHTSKAAVLYANPGTAFFMHPWAMKGRVLFSLVYLALTATYAVRWLLGYGQALAHHLPAGPKLRAQALILLALLPFLFWQPFAATGELPVRLNAYPSAHFLDFATLLFLGITLFRQLRNKALPHPEAEQVPGLEAMQQLGHGLASLSEKLAHADHALSGSLASLSSIRPVPGLHITSRLGRGILGMAHGIAWLDGRWAKTVLRTAQLQVIVAWFIHNTERAALAFMRTFLSLLVLPLRWLVDDQGHLYPGRMAWTAIALGLFAGWCIL